MTPKVVVFDNAAGVGYRRPDGTAARTRLFSLFCAHYGFGPRFRDPYSGHEKGSVENAVGFVRRNLMVPMPSAESFRALTRVWLDECERVAGSDHCRHDVPVIELFEAEKDHMLPLPGVRFDPCDWRSVKADKTGAVTIDANRYPAGPKWRSMWIGNGVLDGFLEDESLFGEFFWAPVSGDGVEPLVVGPPHVVVGVMPQLLDRGVVVPVHVSGLFVDSTTALS